MLVLKSVAVHHSDGNVVVAWSNDVGLGLPAVLIHVEENILQQGLLLDAYYDSVGFVDVRDGVKAFI